PLAGLSETEKAALLQALLTLLAAMQRDGILATARMCPTCRHFVADRHAGAEQPHHCLLLDRPLAPRDLRADCPEHAARAACAGTGGGYRSAAEGGAGSAAGTPCPGERASDTRAPRAARSC